MTNSTPCRSVIQNRVMRSSVIGSDVAPGRTRTGDIVGRDEYLVGDQLACAVEIERTASLVRRKRYYLLYPAIQRGTYDVVGAVDVGMNALHRVVFRDRHMLERRRMHDDIRLPHRHLQSREIPDVSDIETHARIVVAPRHHHLLVLIARVHDNFLRLSRGQQIADQRVAERARASRYKYRLSVQHAASKGTGLGSPFILCY
jgi:hypothetical protein